MEETTIIDFIHPLKGTGPHKYDEKKEDLFGMYKKQISILYERGLVSFEAANLAMCIIRMELGLPYLCIYPVHYSLDKITL